MEQGPDGGVLQRLASAATSNAQTATTTDLTEHTTAQSGSVRQSLRSDDSLSVASMGLQEDNLPVPAVESAVGTTPVDCRFDTSPATLRGLSPADHDAETAAMDAGYIEVAGDSGPSVVTPHPQRVTKRPSYAAAMETTPSQMPPAPSNKSFHVVPVRIKPSDHSQSRTPLDTFLKARAAGASAAHTEDEDEGEDEDDEEDEDESENHLQETNGVASEGLGSSSHASSSRPSVVQLRRAATEDDSASARRLPPRYSLVETAPGVFASVKLADAAPASSRKRSKNLRRSMTLASQLGQETII